MKKPAWRFHRSMFAYCSSIACPPGPRANRLPLLSSASSTHTFSHPSVSSGSWCAPATAPTVAAPVATNGPAGTLGHSIAIRCTFSCSPRRPRRHTGYPYPAGRPPSGDAWFVMPYRTSFTVSREPSITRFCNKEWSLPDQAFLAADRADFQRTNKRLLCLCGRSRISWRVRLRAKKRPDTGSCLRSAEARPTAHESMRTSTIYNGGT